MAVRYECNADENVFADTWEEVSERNKRIILSTGRGLPCSGGGVVGYWCVECPFVKKEYFVSVTGEDDDNGYV